MSNLCFSVTSLPSLLSAELTLFFSLPFIAAVPVGAVLALHIPQQLWLLSFSLPDSFPAHLGMCPSACWVWWFHTGGAQSSTTLLSHSPSSKGWNMMDKKKLVSWDKDGEVTQPLLSRAKSTQCEGDSCNLLPINNRQEQRELNTALLWPAAGPLVPAGAGPALTQGSCWTLLTEVTPAPPWYQNLAP